jgi:hypothetical protein
MIDRVAEPVVIPVPVSLPRRQSADPRLLALLGNIAAMDGSICFAEHEFAALEQEDYFRNAERDRLIHIDEGGEWTVGTVVSITQQGRQVIGELPTPSLWKRLGLAFRRHPA